MLKLLQRVSRYMTALFTGKFNEMADPKVQLEQAIMEAQQQHRALTDQAANVIANQKSIEMRLSRAQGEVDDLQKKARQAILMAEDEGNKGNADKAQELTNAAESFMNKLLALEEEVESLKTLHVQAAQASDQAKAAVQQNSNQLQKKLADRQRLLSQLDQAKMQEQMNAAMQSISGTVGDDVPTLEEVQKKIEQRQAKALGHAELAKGSVESSMLEVEQATLKAQTQSRLDQLKAELGVAPDAAPAKEVTAESQPESGEQKPSAG